MSVLYCIPVSFLCLGATQHLTTIAANILDSDVFENIRHQTKIWPNENENENTDTLQIEFLQKVYVSFKLNPCFVIITYLKLCCCC